jgi:hypothetical protein
MAGNQVAMESQMEKPGLTPIPAEIGAGVECVEWNW